MSAKVCNIIMKTDKKRITAGKILVSTNSRMIDELFSIKAY